MAPHTRIGHDVPALQLRVGPVLAAMTFPARRWQVLAEADLYGCDGVTRSLLDQLPELTYSSLGELLHVLAAVLVGRPVPARPAGRPGVPPGRAATVLRAAPAGMRARRVGPPATQAVRRVLATELVPERVTPPGSPSPAA